MTRQRPASESRPYIGRSGDRRSRGLPGAAGEFEGFGDGEKKFFGEGAADELHADGETVGGR